ncbi:hypothetical protein TWF706_010145 [Orbilia oligospora]|nr:hypothetical protein TWF706_010145 [Orbilia oligospora]
MSIDRDEVSLAESVLSNAAKYIDDLSKNTTPLLVDEEGERINLECEFLVQRIELSFLQHNINAAELMCNNAMERFSRDESAASRLEPRIRESLGKVLYKIGKDMVKRANLTNGVEWLARALEIVDPKYVGSERFAAELRFGIMQNLVQTSLKTQVPNDLRKAEEVMEIMVKEWPERLNVHCLGLDVIVAQELGAEAYHAALMKMMSSIALSERSFKACVSLLTAHCGFLFLLLDERPKNLTRVATGLLGNATCCWRRICKVVGIGLHAMYSITS